MSNRSEAESDNERTIFAAESAPALASDAKAVTEERQLDDAVATATTPAGGVPSKPLSAKIDELRAKQAAMTAERKRVAKDLRNHEKRRRRLKANARRLSNDDLAEVMLMREASRPDADSEKAGDAASSSAAPKKPKKNSSAKEA